MWIFDVVQFGKNYSVVRVHEGSHVFDLIFIDFSEMTADDNCRLLQQMYVYGPMYSEVIAAVTAAAYTIFVSAQYV